MQVDDRTDNHDVHYLVAVAPVVKTTWDKAFRNLSDVHQPSQNSQRIHDGEEPQGGWAAHPTAKHPEQEEAEAKQALPYERSQPQDVCAGCGGTVDSISRQENIGQECNLLQGGVAQQRDVDDGECPWG